MGVAFISSAWASPVTMRRSASNGRTSMRPLLADKTNPFQTGWRRARRSRRSPREKRPRRLSQFVETADVHPAATVVHGHTEVRKCLPSGRNDGHR